MRLKPHGHTILIEPDPPPERTDSGSIILPEDHDYVATSGTVVAVGKGSKRLWEERQRVFRRVMAAFPSDARFADSGAFSPYTLVKKMSGDGEPAPSVCVGDRVVFAAEAGLAIKDEDGRSYILLEEDRVAIIVEEDAA